jgi:sigma-B regulation protein RsbU (phosphoserine phosphatase)
VTSSGVSGGEAAEQFFAALLDDDPVALYDRAPCGYLSTTPDGTIITANSTFLTWTGYDRSALVGRRRFADLLTAGGRIYHETHYAPMLHMQGAAREIALDIVDAAGRRLPALVSSVLERTPNGEPAVVRTAVFDASERRRYEQELLRAKERAEESEARVQILARTLQQTLMPPATPEVPGLDVGAVYRPAGSGDEIGGDFYDIFEIGDGDWVVALGDVCGKGVDAAVVTALARYTIRAAAVRHPGPEGILRTLNEVLLRDATDRFLTVALLRLRSIDGTWTVTVSVGGHPLPLLRRPGEAPTAIGEHGSLLGLFPKVFVHETAIVLAPGDTLVVFTDGVTEGRRGRDLYGDERLHAALLAPTTSAAATAEQLLDRVLQFQYGDPRDDIAIVVLTVPGPAGAHAAG